MRLPEALSMNFGTAAQREKDRISTCGTLWIYSHDGGTVPAQVTESGRAVPEMSCNAQVVVRHHCHSPWCRPCRRKWMNKALEEISPAASRWKRARHVVLTVENCAQGQLEGTIKRMVNAFRRMRQRAIWRKNVWEGVYSWGLTFKKGKWHPHIHIAVSSKFIKAQDLTKAWFECCFRESLTAKHTHIGLGTDRDGLIIEILKGTKGDMKRLANLEETNLEAWGEAVNAFKGRPWFRPLGKFKVFKKKTSDLRCPKCGAPFIYKEWDKQGPYSEEFVRLSRFRSCFHVDFFAEFEYAEKRPPPGSVENTPINVPA